jgi:hypothetical protein
MVCEGVTLTEVAMLVRTLFTLGLGALLAVPALSQNPSTRPDRGRGALPVEAALRHRQRLQLTEPQTAVLRSMREESVKLRQAEMAARLDITSRFRAGELSREAFRAQVRSRREALRPQLETRRGELERALDETQRAALREMVRENRRGMRQGGREFGPRPSRHHRP